MIVETQTNGEDKEDQGTTPFATPAKRKREIDCTAARMAQGHKR